MTEARDVEKMSMSPLFSACSLVCASSITRNVILSRYGSCTPLASFCQ